MSKIKIIATQRVRATLTIEEVTPYLIDQARSCGYATENAEVAVRKFLADRENDVTEVAPHLVEALEGIYVESISDPMTIESVTLVDKSSPGALNAGDTAYVVEAPGCTLVYREKVDALEKAANRVPAPGLPVMVYPVTIDHDTTLADVAENANPPANIAEYVLYRSDNT